MRRFFYFIALALLVISCSENNAPEDKLVALSKHNVGKVIQIVEEDWDAEEKFGEMVKTRLNVITEKEYNEKGYILSETYYNGEGVIFEKSTWEYIAEDSYIKTEYNKDGKPVQEEKVYHINGTIQKIDRLYYDYGFSGLYVQSQYKEVEEYFYTGQQLDSVVVKKDDNARQVVRFEYLDKNGSCNVSYQLYSGEIVNEKVYYNDKKQVIKRLMPDKYSTNYSQGDIKVEYDDLYRGGMIEYEYDEQGNCTSCISSDMNIAIENRYDSNKNVIEQIHSFGVIIKTNYIYKQ